MTENFPKLMPGTKPKIQKAQRASCRINAKSLHVGISRENFRKSKIKLNSKKDRGTKIPYL